MTLFTRPRRFGKTLNMSMLKSFFEIGGNKSIFDGLAISAEKQLCDGHMGKYPVIFISLKGVDGLTFEDAVEMSGSIISREARRFQFLLKSDKLTDVDKAILMKLYDRKLDIATIRDSLITLSEMLAIHYEQNVVLLIDEYDVPLDKAYQHGYYDEMINLIRGMFGAALKTNDSLQFAVLTGCLRVSKESIFTGLNNLKVHSIADTQFDEYFGFNDGEVAELLEYYSLQEHSAELKEWYDGYRFGGQDVYCPWDVINYCYDLLADSEAEPQAYWLNTSGNDMVRRLMDKSDTGTTRQEIERLIAGGSISKTLNNKLTHNEIDKDINNVWSLLYMTGYLTIRSKPRNGVYELIIPNKEVREI